MKKNIIALGVFSMIACNVNAMEDRPLTVKERIALLNAEKNASPAADRSVGQFKGTVTRRGFDVLKDDAKLSYPSLKEAVRRIQAVQNTDTARDVVAAVKSNTRKRIYGERVSPVLAAHAEYAQAIENVIGGLSLEDQVVILEWIQNELAIRAA